jgi:hypothetical protein
MSTQPPKSLFPNRPTLLTVVLASVLGGAFAIGVSSLFHAPARVANAVGVAPSPVVDPRFVPIGRAYVSQLGVAYGAAWEDGAVALDSGQAIPAALDTVAQAWTANRTGLYDRLLTPELVKIVPENAEESTVTAADRAAMAAAWRGFAAGLTGGTTP